MRGLALLNQFNGQEVVHFMLRHNAADFTGYLVFILAFPSASTQVELGYVLLCFY